MHVYLTNILMVKTTKNLQIIPAIQGFWEKKMRLKQPILIIGYFFINELFYSVYIF